MKRERAELIAQYLADYETIDVRGRERDRVGWIALKFSVDRDEAAEMIEAAERAIARAAKPKEKAK